MRKLKLSAKTVNHIAQLSRAIRDWHLDESGLNLVVRNQHNAIFKLSPQQKIELTALMWLGRGTDFEDFESAVQIAHLLFEDDDEMTEYLAQKPLHEYLPPGIQKLRQEKIDLSS